MVGFVLVEDLDDVAVGLRIQDLEHVSAGGQHTPSREMNPGNLHGTAKGDHGLPVPSSAFGAWCEYRAHQRHARDRCCYF